MSRWKVERENSWDGPCWFVFDPDGRYITNRFDWAEALAHADRMARTREVVLPRNPLPLTLTGLGDDTPVTVNQDEEHGCVFLTDGSDGEIIVLYPHELRPLACALLALHYQQEVGE